jgi:hypothetical protein
MALFRSLIVMAEKPHARADRIARIRKAQLVPHLWIIAPEANVRDDIDGITELHSHPESKTYGLI